MYTAKKGVQEDEVKNYICTYEGIFVTYNEEYLKKYI